MKPTTRSRLPSLARLLLLGSLLLPVMPSVAHAVAIEINPAAASVRVGNSVSVDVLATELGGELIGGFDIVVSWDATVLALADAVFGSALGGPPPDSIQDMFAEMGSIEMVEVSLLDPLPQDGIADVLLFSLIFDALAPGSSTLSIVPGADPMSEFLADALGFAIVPTAVGMGTVDVQAVQAVPAPTMALLIALVGLLLVQRQTEVRT